MAIKHSHNDQPTLTLSDDLGTKHFVTRLVEDIKESECPKTFAITGYWGTGKTSSLASVYKGLTNTAPAGYECDGNKENTDYVGIWFEAWRYQNEVTPIVALLQCIKSHFSSTSKFIDSAGKLANISLLGALSVFDGVIKTATGLSGLNKIKDVGEQYEKDNLLNRLASDQIMDALKQAVDVIVGNNSESQHRKLVIFIDDLDRCEPETAYRLLEGLKLYFNIPNCTIVMAIDQQQIERFIAQKMIGSAKQHQRFLGVEYLEKLCQDAYRLPVPTPKQRNQFLISQFDNLYESNLENNETVSDDLKYSLAPYDCLPANPRRLKMIANKMASFYRTVKCDELGTLKDLGKPDASNNELLAYSIFIVSCLSVNYRRLYERLEINPGFTNELYSFCNGVSDEKYEIENSVFYEFNKDHRSIGLDKKIEHPSDLSIFRLCPLFNEDEGVLARYDIPPTILGGIMHQLIYCYNNPIQA